MLLLLLESFRFHVEHCVEIVLGYFLLVKVLSFKVILL